MWKHVCRGQSSFAGVGSLMNMLNECSATELNPSALQLISLVLRHCQIVTQAGQLLLPLWSCRYEVSCQHSSNWWFLLIHYVAEDDLNLITVCFHLPSAGIIDLPHHHAWCTWCYRFEHKHMHRQAISRAMPLVPLTFYFVSVSAYVCAGMCVYVGT